MEPLSEHARAELSDIARAPVPSLSINPGVIGRLLRGGLVESVFLPSPFRTNRGRSIGHLRITEAGRRELGPGLAEAEWEERYGYPRADDERS